MVLTVPTKDAETDDAYFYDEPLATTDVTNVPVHDHAQFLSVEKR